MAGERRLRILARLVGPGLPSLGAQRLCDVCTEVVGVSGAAIMLISSDMPRGSAGSSNHVSRLLEQLQFELGEGPCIDAHNSDRPVLEPDLADPRVPRWLAFSGPAIAAGARAMFGFPLQVGVVRLGALNLYNDRPGDLSDDQHADALVMADITAQALLLLQANAEPGMLSAELERSADLQFVVHQAAGMVAVQLSMSVGHAMARLRGHAFGNERHLADVARDVVARELRFHPSDDYRGAR